MMKKYILILCCLLSISAFGKKKDKTLATPADSTGYAYGLLNGAEMAEGIKKFPHKIEMKAFIKGFKATFTTDTTKRSYEMGLNFGIGLKEQLEKMSKEGINLDKQACQDALIAVLSEQPTLLDKENAEKLWTEVMNTYRERKQKEIEEQKKAEAAKNLAEGKAFLTEKEKEPEVIKTASGLLYKVLKQGEGPLITSDCKVKVHYTGKLIDGTKFDSSYDRGKPLEIGVTNVIKGWTEALQLMNKGSKYIFYIPAELAYGERGAGRDIKPNSVLEFEIEIIDVTCPDKK